MSNGMAFALVINPFGVKHFIRDRAQHLIDTLQQLYDISTDWMVS